MSKEVYYPLLRRRANWAKRLIAEYRLNPGDTWFCTITYDDEHLPVSFDDDDLPQVDVSKRDVQLWFKRIRENYGARLGHIRYFIVSEFGENTLRPHYHAIIFTENKCTTELLNEAILSTWKNGYIIDVSRVRGDGALRYVANYILSPTQELRTLCLMSRRPGLGRRYVDRLCFTVFDSDIVWFHGSEFSLFRRSALDGAQHNALDEVFLDKRIDQHQRDGGYNDDGIFQRLRRFQLLDDGLHLHAAGGHVDLARDEHVAQDGLQRHQLLVLEEDQGAEIVVPVADGVVQHQHGQRRLDQRQDHAPEHLGGVRAVEQCRLLQTLRDTVHEEAAQDQHVIDGDRAWDDHGERRIVEAEVFDLQIQRDQAAGEIHGEHEQDGQHLARKKIRARERIGGADGHDEVQRGADDGVENGVEISAQDILIFKDQLIAAEMEALR